MFILNPLYQPNPSDCSHKLSHFQAVQIKIQPGVITHGDVGLLWQNDCEIILEMNSIKATPPAAFD